MYACLFRAFIVLKFNLKDRGAVKTCKVQEYAVELAVEIGEGGRG